MASIQQEMDAINAACRRVADLEEERLMQVAIDASIRLAAEQEYQALRAKQLAADRLEWSRMQATHRRVEAKSNAGRECKTSDYVYESLNPKVGEIKLKCPWCAVLQLMEINCGIAHCGFRYVANKLVQLPAHGKPDEFANKSFVVGGCGKQFAYDRSTGQVKRSSGL
jgi:hypothetical protein